MPKFRITNTSASSAKGKRTVFLTEVGKTLRPGESCVCNRVNSGTRALVTSKVLKIDEGEYDKPKIFAKEPVPPPLPPTPGQLEDRAKAAADARAIDERVKAAATPATPADPGEPGEPATPATPATPAEPEKPETPATPATPADPGEPGEPATPAEPASEDKPKRRGRRKVVEE